MKRIYDAYPVTVLGFGMLSIALFIICAFVIIDTNVEAQDTTEYEYAALVYEGDSAFVFTDELDVNSELNATLDSMGDDFNLIRSLNLMGARG